MHKGVFQDDARARNKETRNRNCFNFKEIIYNRKHQKYKRNLVPFRGRGTLGSGWQRQTCPWVGSEAEKTCTPELALALALLRYLLSDSRALEFSTSEALLFLATRPGGEKGVSGSKCLSGRALPCALLLLQSVEVLTGEPGVSTLVLSISTVVGAITVD